MTINSYFSNGNFVMNKPNTEIKRWGIVVVQSLNPNDVKTGENLYHDVLQYLKSATIIQYTIKGRFMSR